MITGGTPVPQNLPLVASASAHDHPSADSKDFGGSPSNKVPMRPPDAPRSEPEIEALAHFLREFNTESDRGAALVAASFVDERLREVLEAHFIERAGSKEILEGANAPLGTFSARVAACYALGLIEDAEYHEITIIRKIRNEFGHSWSDVNFDSGRVSDLSRNLPWRGPRELEAGASVRARFNAAVAMLLTDLLWRVRLVRQERRESRKWPNKSRN